MTGDESALLIGVMSILSSRPKLLVARVAIEGTTSNDDPSIASPTG